MKTDSTANISQYNQQILNKSSQNNKKSSQGKRLQNSNGTDP